MLWIESHVLWKFKKNPSKPFIECSKYEGRNIYSHQMDQLFTWDVHVSTTQILDGSESERIIDEFWEMALQWASFVSMLRGVALVKC